MKKKLEICAFNIEDCIKASKYKIDRIEFCRNKKEGGLSPKKSEIAKAIKFFPNIYPIIRPRKGNFIYSEEELYKMVDLIIFCKKVGCRGVVFGALNADNEIDKKKCKILLEQSGNMSTTFHKAFDEVKNSFKAIDDLIMLGFNRVLTSGKEKSALKGIKMINNLAEKTYNKISIMPGGGIRSNNIKAFLDNKYLNEFHSSCIIDDTFSEREIENLIKRISNV